METKRMQPGYALLLLLTIAFTLGALLTLGYDAKAATNNLLGYKGISPLAPLTTLALLGGSFITCKLRVWLFTRKVLPS
jgi:hypothetical protein